MVKASWDNEEDEDEWRPPKPKKWYEDKAPTNSANNMSQAIIKEGYSITSLDLEILVKDLVASLKKMDLYDTINTEPAQSNKLKTLRGPTTKAWLQDTTCPRLRHRDIPAKFHEAAAGAIWRSTLSKIRGYDGKVKLEGRDETPMPAPIEKDPRRSSSVASNMTAPSLAQQTGLTTLETKISLNDANVFFMEVIIKRTPD